MRLIAVAALLALTGTSVLSQKKDQKPSWDVSNPPYPYKEYSFSTNEGTWMNLDVSPDGSTIVFDLLGDIYTIPVTGGKAKALRTGIPFEVQPRFSPDGKKISFTSDAGGGDNIWIMDADGANPRQVTKEDFRLLNNAVWSADGNYLIARKHFTSTRSLGAGELWMYHLSGGEGIQLNKKKNDQQDLGEPDASNDGKYVYYSEDMYPGGYFQYNKDPNSQIYVIKRYDLKTGEIKTVTGGPGGACRPQISPDGRTLAFVKRVRSKTVLYLRDLATGEEWPVYDKLSKDQQEAWAIFGVYPNYKWLPDNQHIVIWAGGKIVKVNTANYTSADIPFTVDCTIKMADALHFEHQAAPDSFRVQAIRHAVTSPDGKLLVFNAAGYLWKKSLPDGKPARLTSGKSFEFEPVFSPDGKQIAFVTWSDTSGGAVMIMQNYSGKATLKKVTKEKGIYRTPSFSADSKKLVYLKDGGNDHQGFANCVETGIFTADLTSGKISKVAEDGLYPTFSADGERIFYFDYEGDKRNLKSMDLTGNDVRPHFSSKYATQIVPSPDNKWIAFSEFYKIYIAPFPPAGAVTDLSAGMKAMPVARCTKDAGSSIHWSPDSKSLMWTAGDEYFKTDLNKRFSFLPGAPDSLPAPDSTGLAIGLVLPSDKPEGKLALKGARIITMDKDYSVIERGTILIESNRIVAIGPEATVTIPAGTKVMDMNGKTIMPGIVDVHAHLGTFRQGLSPQQQWNYYANLAYGVTTTHDPSSNSEMVFSQSEMVKAGNMVGPRIYSTGWILYGADGDFKAVINSLEDAVSAVKRTADWGAFSVKSYNQPRRDQRQQVIEASKRQQVMVVPEGGSFFFHNLSMIMDGHTGIEHNLPIAPLHKDVLSMWSFSKTGITPTLIVSYGSVTGEYYFYQKDSVWTNRKLLNFTPRSVIDSRSRHVTAIPEDEYENGHILISRSLKALMDRGVKVNLGSHGQLQGLGAHWELWMLQQGGMTNMQALQCATINGAYYIGMDKDLGSLEKGKLADLVVLDKNPLENIRNSETIVYTMVNGRLYDATTMNEIGNYDQKRMPFYFETFKSAPAFDFHMTGHGHGDED